MGIKTSVVYLKHRSYLESVQDREDDVREERHDAHCSHAGPHHVQPIGVKVRREADDAKGRAHGRHSGQSQGNHLQGAAAQKQLTRRGVQPPILVEGEVETQAQIGRDQDGEKGVIRRVHSFSRHVGVTAACVHRSAI